MQRPFKKTDVGEEERKTYASFGEELSYCVNRQGLAAFLENEQLRSLVLLGSPRALIASSREPVLPASLSTRPPSIFMAIIFFH